MTDVLPDRLPSLSAEIVIGTDERDLAVRLYHQMLRIREFELRVNALFLAGHIPGTIHLSLGQEACAAGACGPLHPTDWATLTHRGHGQALAKGVTAAALMAELFAKEGGCCRGFGGSLHVGDITVGAVPAIAIVGASVPITAGIAYAFKTEGSGRVALCFTGDGAVGEGDWHEGLNLAATWQLPVVYICENNQYSISTRVDRQFRTGDLAARAASYGMRSMTIDGNNALEVHRAVADEVDRIRQGDSAPAFIECLTYRQGGHKRDDPGTYRPSEEVQMWLDRDPVTRMERAVRAALGEEVLARIAAEVSVEMDEAVAFAMSSPPAEGRLTR